MRPHEAFGQQTPASMYRPSARPFPRRLPEIEYPTHFRVERAYPNGIISFRGIQWYLSGCLSSELVGLEMVDDDRTRVYFGPIALGVLDLRNAKDRGCRQFATLVRFDGEVTSDRRRRRTGYLRSTVTHVPGPIRHP